MPNEKQFIDGLFAKLPHEKAPDFVKCTLSIKRDVLIAWLQGREEEWVNIQVKEAKSGKWYCEVNNWQPNAEHQGREATEFLAGAPVEKEEVDMDTIPF